MNIGLYSVRNQISDLKLFFKVCKEVQSKILLMEVFFVHFMAISFVPSDRPMNPYITFVVYLSMWQFIVYIYHRKMK